MRKSEWSNGSWNGGKTKATKGKHYILVEAFVLNLGSSFHSESSILTTLFGLLFWPILYMDIPGAFETPYQLAPLDLGDDSFYRSRQADIEERLQRMTNTNAAITMLREIDQVERDRGTLAIGVNWAYERQDLEEIITVSLFS